jgi:branched-chain amino acid transport system substrate-binding protein
MTPQLTRLKEKGADSLVLVANAAPGAQVMKSLERMGWKVSVISHWGISGERFTELAGPTAGDAHFVQTYSFFGKLNPAGERVLAALKSKYGVKGPEEVFAPVGVANAYDAMHLLAGACRADDCDAGRESIFARVSSLLYTLYLSRTMRDVLRGSILGWSGTHRIRPNRTEPERSNRGSS